MKKLLFILTALGIVGSAKSQNAEFHITTDTPIDVRICAPIAGFMQNILPDAEFVLRTGESSLTELTISPNFQFSSLDILIEAEEQNAKYLKFILFAGDCVAAAYENGNITVNGSNKEGHKLYLDKIVWSYETMPTNLVLRDMQTTKKFTDYDKFIESVLITPIEEQMDNFVQQGLVDKRFAEAAIIDHRNNLFSYIVFQLQNHTTKDKSIPKRLRKQATILQEQIKNERLTMSTEQAGIYPQSHPYVSFKTEYDFNNLSPSERAELLGDYENSLSPNWEMYFTLTEELRAIRLLTILLTEEDSLALAAYFGASKSEIEELKEQYKRLKKYLNEELANTEAVQITNGSYNGFIK